MEDNDLYKTKKSNTFRYKSFVDRVNEIDLRHLTFYHVSHKNEELSDEVTETYFYQTLKKWLVLNLSEEFSIFCRKVIKVVSLPQLIHKKDYVIETLLDHIKIATNLSLQSLLELLYILAKDLREEFYPYLQRVLTCLIRLLNTQDAEQLEWTLTCFAYMCKMLKTYLKRNIGLLFYNILPLLDEQHYAVHINNFAAECFSFIARDVKDFGKFLDYLLNTLMNEDNKTGEAGRAGHYVQGCGRLLFEIIRGIKGQFHSCAGDFFEFLWVKLSKIKVNDDHDRKCMQLLNAIIHQTIDNVLQCVKSTHITLLWQKLCLITHNTNNPIQLKNLIKVYQQIAIHKNGKYLTDMEIIVPSIIEMIDKTLKVAVTETTSSTINSTNVAHTTTTTTTILRMIIHLISTIVMCGCGTSCGGSDTSTLITQLDTSRLLKKALTIKERSLYEEFIIRLAYHPQFHIFILPSFIEYFEEYFDERALELMAEVILKKYPLQFNALQMEQVKEMEKDKRVEEEQSSNKYKWNIKLKHNETLTKIDNLLNKLQQHFDIENNLHETQILLLIIGPHFKNFQSQKFLNVLKNVQLQLLNKIKQQQQQEQEQKRQRPGEDDNPEGSKIRKYDRCEGQLYCFGLLSLITAIQYQLKCFPLDDANLNDLIEVLLKHQYQHQYQQSKFQHAKVLGCLNQLIAVNAKRIRKTSKLIKYLTKLLAHHDHQTKLLASHSLCQLYNNNNKVYEVFYKVLRIETNVHTFREQLVYIKQLHKDSELIKSFKSDTTTNDADNNAGYDDRDNDDCKVHCVYFLLGLLYENFKDLWVPIQKLLQEYCQVMKSNKFWDIYYGQMQKNITAINMETQKNMGKSLRKSKVEVCKRQIYSKVLIKLLLCQIQEIHDVYDDDNRQINLQQLYNYRILLWQPLIHFGKLLEVRNRDIVDMFLTFLHKEYYGQQQIAEWTWNLIERFNDTCNNTDIEMEKEDFIEEDESEDNCEENYNKFKDISSSKNNSSSSSSNKTNNISHNYAKILMKTIQTKLNVFSSYNNPKALYRELELWEFYKQLITARSAILQKSALDCIMAYKIKAIITYKEHFYNILDEKKFRNTLINFNINEIVEENHRSTFQEIFLRLLYGKMLMKGNKKSISTQQRKSIILRFLGNCHLKEIEWFIAMAFMPFKDYLNETICLLDIPGLVRTNFRLTAAWSGKKLQSSLNLWELLRKEFGGRMHTDFHVYMLKLLIFVGSICQEVLQTTAITYTSVTFKIHSKIPVVYRNVKQNCLQCLLNFFVHLDNFEWSDSVISCITDIFVYPQLERLPQDSVQTPSVLLKLLLEWGSKSKHFRFLLQKQTDNGAASTTIFHYIMQLLMNEKIKRPVLKSIKTMVEYLLETCTNANGNNIKAEDSYVQDALALIEPHIPVLLKHLKGRLQMRIKGKLLLDKQDLNILSMLTKLVKNSNTCDQLLQILLPNLVNICQANAATEAVNQIIHTLMNLIKQLEQPELYIRRLAPFFEHIQEVNARKELCNLITDIVRLRANHIESSNELITMGRIILLLNSWDKRWVEQPDYKKRLQGFREMEQLINGMDSGVCLDLGVLVIYNCFHFLRYDKDTALRDNASEQLRLLLPFLVKKFAHHTEELKYLVNDVVIPLISQIIRDNQVNVRNEGIRLLGVMVRTSSNCHSILKELYPLVDKDNGSFTNDVENDFFENLTHLQSHRHSRALLRFCNYAGTLTQPIQCMTLTKFLLPLASHYLLKEQYAGNHSLIDAAIESIGIICQFLPWQQYYAIFKYYLLKLKTCRDFQRQCVRVVTRILDGFHYDLCLDELNTKDLEELRLKVVENNAKTTSGKVRQCPVINAINANECDVMMNSVVKYEKQEEQETNTVDDVVGDNLDDVLDNNLDDVLDNNLDDVLDNNLDDINIENENLEVNEEGKTRVDKKSLNPYLSKMQKLSSNASKKILNTISTMLIPILNRCITENMSYYNKHKLNRRRFNIEHEEEEILRVPIALALIKLMQKLPKNILHNSLRGVLMKVCTFLRSPLISVRRCTLDILKKIILCLGSEYLGQIMEHLQALLTRGFQVHVLSVTVYGILEAVQDKLQPQHLESCMSNILEVALNDIFGEINAEKSIHKLHNQTPEAKPSSKSYLVLQIIALNIRERCLLDLLLPFREYLVQSKSRKLILKIQECFNKIVNGLVENSHLPLESLLIFIHGTISESIHDLLPGTERQILSEKDKEKMRRSRPDCFIIPAEPGRRFICMTNRKVKTNAQVNAHILIEFGLELLYIVLKRKKLRIFHYEPFLNPLMALLRDSLKSCHIRVIVFTLKCFNLLWMEDYKLSSLEDVDNMKMVVAHLFQLLKNFTNFGVTKQDDNLQLIQTTFKAVVTILHKCDYYQFTDEQIDQLTLHIAQDLQELDSITNITFNLIEALLQRKVNTRPMHDIMKSIRDISIISQSDYIRNKARTMLIIYVMECCEYRKIEQIVKDLSVQLLYVTPSGRLSAIKFFEMIIRKIPLNILNKFASFLYLSLATRLVNDVDPECREGVALCIESLLKCLDKVTRQDLFNITLQLFKADNKPSIREMGAALCSRFVNAEKEKFSRRLKIIFPVITERLISYPNSPGRFVRAPHIISNNDEYHTKSKRFKQFSEEPFEHFLFNATQQQIVQETQILQQQALDHELLQLQYCLLKIFDNCSEELFQDHMEFNQMIDELAYECQRLLAHDHAGVRSNCIKLLTYIIGSYDFGLIGSKLIQYPRDVEEAEIVKDNKMYHTQLNFIYYDPEYDIKALVSDLCAQVVPGDSQTAVVIDDISQLFLFIATMLKDVPFACYNLTEEEKSEGKEENKNIKVEDDFSCLTKINLNWLMRNIRYLINKEVNKTNNNTIIRHALFKLLEGFIALLSTEALKRIASSILTVLIREMSEDDQNVDPDLRQLALRVGSRLRQKIGMNLYAKLKIDAEMKLKERRSKRKRLLIQEKVHDPERAAKRHASMQQRKKVAKKTKIYVKHGKVLVSHKQKSNKLRQLKKRLHSAL